jgi:hypothetical protein
MIITKLKGGLGNQLFQWSFARNISNLYNQDLYLDISFLKNTPDGNTKRNFNLDVFPNLTGDYTKIPKISKEVKIIDDSTKYSHFQYESSYDYFLDGYFQDYKYFEDSSNLIRSELKPSTEVFDSLKSYPFIHTNTTSIHIRRTDYLKSNGYHPVQSIEYYKNALDMIGKYDYLFVFSDDIQWCKENLNFDNMIFVESGSEVEDLYLMSMCKNNIIANSSFSWWGAWLNQNENKKVILPKRWFADYVEYDTNNSPQDWIRI